MKHKLIIGLSVLALCSCTDNLIYTEPDNEAILTGNTYKAAFTETSSVSTFNSGSQILLNASGSIQADNEVLTYTDGQWKAGNEFSWNYEAESTDITVLYPVYSDLTYRKENIYSKGTLEDILYVKSIYPTGNNINLKFNHLFSLLTLRLDEKLQNGFQKMEVTCPAVASIVPESAQIILADNETHTTSVTQTSSSGNYLFIIPPAENMTISIDIQMDGKQYSAQLQSKSFASGQEYTYKLKTSETTPGIVTAEDWIAFSQLTSSNTLTSYNGKTLKDFGKTVDGVTTYYLLNDIDFTGVNCTNLKQIKENDSFNDVFNGQGYTISNLTPKTGNGTTGLFASIGETGIVKDLHMNSCSTTLERSTGSSKGTGILAGVCYGIITNCSVKNGEINSKIQSTPTGGLVGDFRNGTIINSYVQNFQISGILSAGGLVGNSYGTILNCFSANNTIEGTSNSGGISGRSDLGLPTIISNCYVYNLKVKKTSGGLFYGAATNSSINHCLYNTTYTSSASKLIGSGSSNTQTDIFKYSSNFTYNSTPVYQFLNQWIDKTVPTLYPDSTFTLWTDGGESLPAIFVTESKSKSK